MNQSEAHLHSGCTVHFHPVLSPRPSFWFFKGPGSETADYQSHFLHIILEISSDVSLLFANYAHAISRLHKCIAQSQDWLCKLEFDVQFPDSENVQRNLEIVQIPKLHGTKDKRDENIRTFHLSIIIVLFYNLAWCHTTKNSRNWISCRRL